MEKCKIIYHINISLECASPLLVERSIDQFLKEIPEYLLSLANSNEKMEVTIDKQNKK